MTNDPYLPIVRDSSVPVPAPPGYPAPAPSQLSYVAQPTPMQPAVRPFVFDGGAATYLGTAVAAFLVTVFSLGLLAPWGMVIRYRWRSKHTIVNGYRLRFTGSAFGLFGNWLKWWFFLVITLGIYSFWVVPRLTRWQVEHQEFLGPVAY
jgi:uncharacterized membrane protein YjgN (DUF898 family)